MRLSLLGLDIGGTNLKAAWLTPDGTVLGRATVPAGGAIPRDVLLAKVVQTAREMTGGQAARVGIAVGGAVQPDGTMTPRLDQPSQSRRHPARGDLRRPPRRAVPGRA